MARLVLHASRPSALPRRLFGRSVEDDKTPVTASRTVSVTGIENEQLFRKRIPLPRSVSANFEVEHFLKFLKLESLGRSLEVRIKSGVS